MGKEAKVGIVVVGVLAGALIGLAVKRFVLTAAPASHGPDPSVAAQPKPLPPEASPTVVAAQQSDPALDPNSRLWDSSPADSNGGMPRDSFLPAETDPNARYAQQDEPQPIEPQEPVPSDGNPFAGPVTPEAQPTEQPLAPQQTPSLEARRPSGRSTRNPLRQLSAEEAEGEAADAVQFPENNGTYDDPFPEVNPATDAEMPAEAEPPAAAPAADEAAIDLPAPAGEPAPAADPFSRAASQPAEVAGAPADRYQNSFDEPQPAAEYQPPVADNQAQPAARAPLEPTRPADGRYTVEPNDSLWKVAEKVYGDGRYFKAIGEHNRARLAHPDQLSAGEVLDVPPTEILQQRYPSLCPKQRRSVMVDPRTRPAAAQEPVSRGESYIVAEGDTLFDIARYELGKASRWGEIYELNREKLGEDFDFLQLGLELRMPPRDPAATARQPADRYQR
jgi:nucleoid-associated protein YgaU